MPDNSIKLISVYDEKKVFNELRAAKNLELELVNRKNIIDNKRIEYMIFESF